MALSGLRQGPRYLKPSSGKSYTKYISWKDGDAKTIAFLTPAEEFAKVRLHNFVKVEDDLRVGSRPELMAALQQDADGFGGQHLSDQCPGE